MRIPVVTLVLLVGAVAATGTQSPRNGLVEWTDYGGDVTGAKYSTAADITRENVNRLQIAWEWHAPDKAMPGPNGGASTIPGRFNTTPLGPTTIGGANWGGAAFDPETGLLYVKSTDGVVITKAGN